MRSQPEQVKIDKYLDRMCSHMRWMPRAARTEARQEASQHLETLIADLETQGHDPTDAVDIALFQFGDPEKIGHETLIAWMQKRRSPQSAEAGRREWLGRFLIGIWVCILVLPAYTPIIYGSWVTSMTFAVLLGLFMDVMLNYNPANRDEAREALEGVRDVHAHMLKRIQDNVKETPNIRNRIASWYVLHSSWFFQFNLRRLQIMSEEPTDPIKRLNRRFFIVRLIQVSAIWLLPLDVHIQGVLMYFWVIFTVSPFGALLGWRLNQPLRMEK